jgi:hypothetical protein
LALVQERRIQGVQEQNLDLPGKTAGVHVVELPLCVPKSNSAAPEGLSPGRMLVGWREGVRDG